jgi:hypothetical protein
MLPVDEDLPYHPVHIHNAFAGASLLDHKAKNKNESQDIQQ